MKLLSQKNLIIVGAFWGVAYGLFARFIFGLGIWRDFFEVMSLAFIFGTPLSLGFISVWIGPYRLTGKIGDLIIAPWLAALACLFCALALVWEGIICIIIWLPLVIVLSLIGGLLAWLCLKLFKSRRDRNYCVTAVALLPFIVAPLERLHVVASETNTAQTVWNQIRSVPLISEREQSRSFSHLLGFPRPLEAKLIGEGVGAIRRATFEHGVLFVETITEWDEPHRLSFSIHADTKNIPPTTFDEHVIVGGKYFDVLNGSYSIENFGGGDIILHLSSEQRLSTRFNFYSHFWTEYLMADLQNYILQIIKTRCEMPVSNS